MAYLDINKRREADKLRQRRHRAKLKQAKTVTLIVESVTPIPEIPQKQSDLMKWVFSDI